jgi:hypothetical protein
VEVVEVKKCKMKAPERLYGNDEQGFRR